MGFSQSNEEKALSCVHIEFRVKINDLGNAARQLAVTQSQNLGTGFADLLVSENVATLRTAVTSIDVTVKGIYLGVARLPLATLQKIVAVAATFKKKELPILIWDGLVKIGTWQTRNEEIGIGPLQGQKLDPSSDATVLDTLALAWLLTPAGVREHGLDRRVAEAQEAMETAIDMATTAMENLRIDRKKIAALAEEQIAEAGKGLRNSLLK